MLDISLCKGKTNNLQCKKCERYMKNYDLKGKYYSIIFVEGNDKLCEYFIEREE